MPFTACSAWSTRDGTSSIGQSETSSYLCNMPARVLFYNVKCTATTCGGWRTGHMAQDISWNTKPVCLRSCCSGSHQKLAIYFRQCLRTYDGIWGWMRAAPQKKSGMHCRPVGHSIAKAPCRNWAGGLHGMMLLKNNLVSSTYSSSS